jgi:hypothetical protein
MTIKLDPLRHNVPIVDRQGFPTPQFLQQWQAMLDQLKAAQADTGVEAGSYGGVAQDMAITVDARGRITLIEDV